MGDYMKELLKYIDIDMIPKEFGGKGIWKPRLGNVPIDFPFQMDEFKEKRNKNNDDDGDKNEVKDDGVKERVLESKNAEFNVSKQKYIDKQELMHNNKENDVD